MICQILLLGTGMGCRGSDEAYTMKNEAKNLWENCIFSARAR